MSEANNTALICTNCGTPFKITKRCRNIGCNKFCCSSCSINGFCIDCFVIQAQKEEIDIYMFDKNIGVEI